jgi:predicted anti-sigma-YlaC factor YlaD
MTCDETLNELTGGPPSPAVHAHLAECEACREAAHVVAAAALPPLSLAEQEALATLPANTRSRYFEAEHHRAEQTARWRQAGWLAVAAGLGALLATGANALRAVERPARVVPASVASNPRAPQEEANLSDEEVFFEVSWPQPTEGDL